MIENPNQDTTSVSGSHDNRTHAERRGETGNHPCRAGRRFTPTACWSASCFGDAASKEAGTQGTHSFAWAHKIPLTKFSWGQRFTAEGQNCRPAIRAWALSQRSIPMSKPRNAGSLARGSKCSTIQNIPWLCAAAHAALHGVQTSPNGLDLVNWLDPWSNVPTR